MPGRWSSSSLSNAGEMASAQRFQVSFEDVSVHFSEEEWVLLDPDQQALHWEVMEENYKMVASLAWPRRDGTAEDQSVPSKKTLPILLNDEKVEKEIIEFYRSNPHLWNPSHVDYYKKNRRDSTLTVLRDLLASEHGINITCGDGLWSENRGAPCKAWLPDQTREIGNGPVYEEDFSHQESYLNVDATNHTETGEPKRHQLGDSFGHSIHLTNGEKEKYKCLECGKTFHYSGNLTSHKRTHMAEKPYKCQECGKGFAEKRNLLGHEMNHRGERPYQCSECGKGFSYKANLKRHLIFHTEDKSYTCQECGKCFHQKADLGRHQKTHTGEKPHQCQECGKGFAEKRNLIEHEINHRGEKPYKCLECGMSFSYKSVLKRHRDSHTEEKSYTCQECGKGFCQKRDLSRHQKTHTGEKPYKCLECGKGFTQRKYLVAHEMNHRGEKAYMCQECGKGFSQRSVFNKHQNSHKMKNTHVDRKQL